MGAIYLSFLTKLESALTTVYGWLVTGLLFVANFFVGYGLAIIAVVVCILVDAGWAIAASFKTGKKPKSKKMRKTFIKLAAYGSALLMVIFVEKLIGLNTPICAGLVSSTICLTELWSMAGSALIINPQLYFLRLLRPALKGEIANKLGISEDKVDDVLDGIEQ